MKVMKKALTMLFVMMMVLGMGTAVSAAEGNYDDDDGTITISNAIDGQTYNLYRILKLESFYDENPSESTAIKRYAYKVETGWEDFIKIDGSGEGNGYLDIEDGYVKWKSTVDESKAAEFAKKALAYAKTKNIVATKSEVASGTTVNFSNLKLGYYLVDSSVGALCSLNTTNLTATITEKNSVPTLSKLVGLKGTSVRKLRNTAEIGQILEFETYITVGDGPQQYILHDEMDPAFTYNSSTLKVVSKAPGYGFYSRVDESNYSTTTTDGHTFDVVFTQTFLDGLKKGYKIKVIYEATLNENAKIGSVGNKNKTWVSYGDKQAISNITETITRTYGIPVFKFYKTDVTGTTSEQPLANVKFKLSSNADADLNSNTDFIKFVKNATTDVYRKALDTDAAYNTELASNNLGKITLQGLAAGTYYLYETETVKGYNKLTKAVQIEIKEDGTLWYANKGEALQQVDAVDGLVKIENKTGTVLPSTGGMGTTMMYIAGAMLLIGSGVLLITKKNMK